MTVAKTVAETIAGEATSGTSAERWNDMLNIASVMVNRAAMLGVSLEDVVSAPGQFNAYNTKMPPGTGSLVDMAQAALDQVQEQGPVNNASFYATPAAVDNLPSGLVAETETAGHQFFSDPAMRSIITAQGAIRPDPNALPSIASMDPLQQAINAPYEANGLLNGVTSLTNAPAQAVTSQSLPASAVDPAFSPTGLLSGDFPTSSFNTINPTATADNFASLGMEGMAKVPSTLGSVPASADANASLGLDADARVTGLIDNASIADRMGVPNSSFPDMAAARPVQAPMDVQGILGAMAQPQLNASASVPMSASLFSPAIQNPTTNSFADLAAAQSVAAPVGVPASADLATTPAFSAEAAASMPSSVTGINSPEQKAMDASVESQLSGMSPLGATATNNSFSDLAQAGAMAAPVSATPSGLLGAAPDLSASATPTGLLSGYQATPTDTAAESAIGGLLSQAPSMSPASIAGYQQLANTAVPGGLTNLAGTTTVNEDGSLKSSLAAPSQPQVQNSLVGDYADEKMFDQAYAPSLPSLSVPSLPSVASPVNIAQDPAVSMPSLPTMSVPDQPTVAAASDENTVQGPATTAAVTQQQPSLSGSFPSAPAKQGLLGGLINKSTITGGLLGSLAAGPMGGILGGLLGSQINKAGGLTGLLSGPGFSVNNIGSGMQNVASVYGGAPAGTQASTNNGGSVTSTGGGWSTYTDPNGVTTSFGPNNLHASYFGPDLDASHTPGGTPGGGGGVGGGLF